MSRTSTSLKGVLVTGAVLTVAGVGTPTHADPARTAAGRPGVELTEIGRHTPTNVGFDEGAAEIVAFDAATARLFVVNGSEGTLDVLDASDPTDPSLVSQIDLAEYGASLTGVDAGGGLAAVAVHPENAQAEPGRVVILDTATLDIVADVAAGYLPDAVVFDPDSSVAMVANEGEPSSDYAADPEGSLTLVDLETFEPTQVDFRQYDGREDELDESIRIFGPGASVSQDLEPENITFSSDGERAWVTLQENNAMAHVDVAAAEVTDLFGLGFKDWTRAGAGFDASNRDGGIEIRDWPVLGIPQPDAVAGYDFRGETFLVTANEGDARDYDTYSEERRLGDVGLCEGYTYGDMSAEDLVKDENLGRLNITLANGYDAEDDCVEEIYAYGARSFSIYDATGELVYDSGSDFEEITAEALGTVGFNANNDESGSDAFDSRSDDKGPEPEGVAVGRAFGRTLAFVGLERVGGVMTYDVTDPHTPEFMDYANGRDFEAATAEESVDLGPEGVLFIPADDSPNGAPLLVLSHEVTGTTTVYEVRLDTPARRG